MSKGTRIWPLLTATIRYEKTVSLRNIGHGEMIDAPVMAYLIETSNGRLLYDVGCDYSKISSPERSAHYFGPMAPVIEPPVMTAEQQVPAYLQRLGLGPKDIDLVFISHLHWDHAGGLCDFPGCEVHLQQNELAAAQTGKDEGVFPDELAGHDRWRLQSGEYTVTDGVEAITTPGHTAGHMSLVIELAKGPPVVLCGDAADLTQNLEDEIAPGFCWEDDEALALTSIRKLKDIARREKARLWPNHDMAFFRRFRPFPEWTG